jgi:hypothetical protein
MLRRAADFDEFFGMTSAKKNGHEIWHMECEINLIKIWLGGGGVDWIHLAQDRDQRRAPVNTVMNLRVP